MFIGNIFLKLAESVILKDCLDTGESLTLLAFLYERRRVARSEEQQPLLLNDINDSQSENSISLRTAYDECSGSVIFQFACYFFCFPSLFQPILLIPTLCDLTGTTLAGTTILQSRGMVDDQHLRVCRNWTAVRVCIGVANDAWVHHHLHRHSLSMHRVCICGLRLFSQPSCRTQVLFLGRKLKAVHWTGLACATVGSFARIVSFSKP